MKNRTAKRPPALSVTFATRAALPAPSYSNLELPSSGNFPNKPSEESVNSVMSPLSIPARLCEMMRFATSTYFPKNHTDDSRSAEVCVLDDVEAVAHDGGLVVRCVSLSPIHVICVQFIRNVHSYTLRIAFWPRL